VRGVSSGGSAKYTTDPRLRVTRTGRRAVRLPNPAERGKLLGFREREHVSTGTADSSNPGQVPAGTPLRGEIIADKYEVEGLVGAGGMGVVVAARHRQLGQTVAIKLLLGDGDGTRPDEARARFLREAQAAARLRSDHVVRIYDVGTLENGAPFMVMELLEGVDLGALIDLVGQLPIETAADYVVQACRAVTTAHKSGIVHRDLKPSNLFVGKRSDGADLIKVLDFGISKAVATDGKLEASLTTTRTVVGSPYYMSPEQVRDAKRVDARTDVWSLGMILYELLSGRPAFEADTLPAICAAIAADVPTPIRELRPDVPVELGDAIMRCLEKNLALRVQSVDELMTLLDPFVPRTGSMTPSLVDAALAERGAGRRVSQEAPTMSPEVLPSSREAGSPSGDSGVRAVRSTDATGPTLLSPVSAPQGRTARKRSLLWIAVGAAVLAAVVGWAAVAGWDRPAPDSAIEQAPADPTPSPKPFRLVIDSEPPSAAVFEGEQSLGETPLSLSISGISVRSEPRVFTVVKPGYRPYTVIQGPTETDARVVAKLTAVPVAIGGPASAVPSAAPPPLAPSRRAGIPAPRVVPRPPKPARTSTNPAPPPSDIRLER
jgi:hypothetical protein